MTSISILLPSLRPELLARRIAEFAATNPESDYEIIVVAPFPVEAPKVRHIHETERRGVIYAMNEAYTHASGDYIVLWSDDAIPRANCLGEITRYVDSKPVPFIASFALEWKNGKPAEEWSVYGRRYAGWLCAKKETIVMAGGLFDLVYKNYWADPDLSLRVWEKGGAVARCPSAWISVEQIDDDIKKSNLGASFMADTQTFFGRWHGKYGGNTKPVWWKINRQIPESPMSHVRQFLRHLPYLKPLKDRLCCA